MIIIYYAASVPEYSIKKLAIYSLGSIFTSGFLILVEGGAARRLGNPRVRAEGSDIYCTSSLVRRILYVPFVTLWLEPKIDEIGCDSELPSHGSGPNVGSVKGGRGIFPPGGRSGKKREAHRAAHPSPAKVGVIPRRLTSAGARAVAKLLGVIFVKSPLTQTEQAAETDAAGSEPTRLLLLPQE